jgi:hypothetical protein
VKEGEPQSRKQILDRHGPLLDDLSSLVASTWLPGEDNGTVFGIDPYVYIVILENMLKSTH